MIRQSLSLTKLAPALTTAQAEMVNAPKETRGQVGNAVRYYTDLPTITDLVRPVLARHGLCFTQFPSGGGDGTVTVTTRIIHSSGEWMEGELSMPCSGNGAQGVGSAITYAKRYALMAVLGVAADDDDGAAASPPQRRRVATPPTTTKTITDAQRKRMFAMARAAGLSTAELRAIVARHNGGGESTQDLTLDAYEAILHDVNGEPHGPAGGGDPETLGLGPQQAGGLPRGAAGAGDAGADGMRKPTAPANPEPTREERWADLTAYADGLGFGPSRLKTMLRAGGLVTGPEGVADAAEYERARAAVENAHTKEHGGRA